MAKYIISINLDKLPAEVLSVLVENGCSIEKYTDQDETSRYIDKIRSEIEADKQKFDAMPSMQESPKATAVRLISEAKRFVKANTDKFGYGERTTYDALDSAARYIGRGEYRLAYNDINYCSHLAENFDKYPELMSALAELI